MLGPVRLGHLVRQGTAAVAPGAVARDHAQPHANGRAGGGVGGVSSAMKVYSSFTVLEVPRRDGEGLRIAQEPAAVGVLEIEDGVERPVEVISEPGRLPEELLGDGRIIPPGARPLFR